MPLSVANAIQRNSGTFNGTTGTATLPVATTAGNTVILVVSQNAGLVTPAGFTADNVNGLVTPKVGVYRKSNVGAESSWTIAPSSTATVVWSVVEYEALDLLNALDVNQTGAMGTGTGSTLSTGLTAVASTYDGLVVAVHSAIDTTSPTPGTWSGHTGGLVEVADVGGNNGTISVGMSVSEAYTYYGPLATWTCTATKTAPSGQGGTAAMTIYTAANARRAAQIAVQAGFGMGTTEGLAVGRLGTAYFDTITGTPAVVATSPRSGTHCLELSSSSAAENVGWTGGSGASLSGNGSTATQQCCRFSVYFPTSLPSGDVLLFSTEQSTAGQGCFVRFIAASSSLQIQVGTGTAVVSSATVSANTWISVDYRIDARTTTHVADWKVMYSDGSAWVDQTQATMAGATVAIFIPGVRIGWTASTTATVRYADVVVSGIGGHHPLGDYKIIPLGVDPAVPFVLSGTSTNFNTFTANGTLAAWNATVAHNNADEWPPTLGASADGWCQVATATSDYVEMPMSTVDVATTYGGAVRGVRAIVPCWAATTTAATIGLRAHDGVTELQIASTTTNDPQADNTTATGWICGQVRASTTRQDWSQAKLDALTLRVGFSNDASPVIGVHGALIEVAVRIGDLVRITEGEGFSVDFRIDPDSGGVIAIIVTTPAGTRGATFSWTVAGVPDSFYAAPNTTTTEVIGATDIATMTECTLAVDPV